MRETEHEKGSEAKGGRSPQLHIRPRMDLLKKNDIFAQATFIIGDRNDSHESIEELRQFVNEVDPDLAIFMILTPFPGTKIRESMIKTNRLPQNDNRWDLYSCFDVIFPPKNMSQKELEAGLLSVYNTVYSRSEHLKRSRNMIDIFKNLKYFK